MSEESSRRHVFISHHHKDDSSVDDMQRLLRGKGYDVRNSSIRINKPENQKRLEEGRVSERVIKRLIKMKMKWAKTVVVLVGEKTHTRPWVNWEIEEAKRQGKEIVGVFERGGTDYELPEKLRDYASQIVAWTGEGIISAIDGSDAPFQNPDGTPAAPIADSTHVSC